MPRLNLSSHPEIVQPIDYNHILANQNIYTPSTNHSIFEENKIYLEDIYSIEQDYIDLFLHTRKGHMAKYVHMYRPYIYDNVSKQDSYYPFRMECDLIAQKADEISSYFQEIAEAVEIGPGSYSPVISKTVPLLKALERQLSFSAYKAMDSNLGYAEQACQIIQGQFPTLKTEAIEIDFLSMKKFEIMKNNLNFNKKKLLFCFGQSIFSNNSRKDIFKFLNNIRSLLGINDYFLFAIDTNKDKTMIEDAYNTTLSYELLLNSMYYLKTKLILKDFNPKGFDLVYKWNQEESSVELFLKSTMNQIIKIREQLLVINKDQEFNILNSLKLDLGKIEDILFSCGLRIKEIIDENQKNKLSILIVKKKHE
jgi:L-histidine N-alpha-methyltransferase